MNNTAKWIVGIVGTVAACLASAASAIELSRPVVRAEVARMLRQADLATQKDIDRVLVEIRELRGLLLR